MEPAELFESVLEFIGLLVQRYGPLGIAAAMFAESAGVPFASAVVIVTAGGFIYSGRVSFWALLAASTAGITAGSMVAYFLGYLSSTAGHFIKDTFMRRPARQETPPLTARSKSRVLRFWERYGSFSVFMGQLFGFTRTFISFPAGAMKMNFFLFVAYTALGGALFSVLAIGFSMAITGALGLLLRFVRHMLSLPPWTWAGILFVLMAAAATVVRRGWHTAARRFLARTCNRILHRKK